jgi:hypothetical protein
MKDHITIVADTLYIHTYKASSKTDLAFGTPNARLLEIVTPRSGLEGSPKRIPKGADQRENKTRQISVH